MAKKASSRFQVLVQEARSFAEGHPDVLKVGLGAAIIAFFFTHGLPLFDDDYSQWKAKASGGFFDLVLGVLLPFTREPQTWGFSDRPLQVLYYKIFGAILGDWGTGYFFLKSLAFGGLAGFLFHWMRRLGVERIPAMLCVGVFALSTNAIAAVIWHADFGVFSQLILVATLFYALPLIEKGPSSVAVYRKGYAGLPVPFRNFLLIFFAAVYFGAKLKGDVRLAPVILLTYLAIFRPEKAKVYAAPFGVTFLATLPLSATFLKHLPPFVPGAAGYQGWTYGTFSLPRVLEFLFGGLFTLKTASLSVFGAVGIFLALAALGYGGFRAAKDRLEAPDHRYGFFLAWFGVAVLACGILRPLNPAFQLRYTLIPLVPALLCLAMLFQAAWREFGKVRYFKQAVYGVFALQLGLHAVHDYQHRRDMGRTMIAVDQLYATVEKDAKDGTLVFLPGFLNYGYKDSAAPVIKNRKAVGEGDITKERPGATFAASWSSTLDPLFAMEKVVSGCGSSLFDVIAPCGPTDGAMLLKYVGPSAEVAQADQLARQGNLAGARDVMDGYLKQVPGNHGAAFVQSLYLGKLGDYARNEVIYDQIGPYFRNHVSVIYNWGLAKQGVQKFKESAELLETAYGMAPKDYGVGFNLADTYYRQGKKSRALATLGDLMKQYPNDQTMKNVYQDWSKR